MTAKLNIDATELGTLAVSIACTDDADAAITPNTLAWTLSDRAGNIINERQDVSVTPDNPTVVVLSGEDLSVSGNRDFERVFAIQGTYDSDLGSDLPLTGAVQFTIDAIPGIS